MTLEVALMGHKRAGLVVEVPDLVGIFLVLQEHVHRRQVCALLKHGHGPPPVGFVNLLLARAVAEGPCHFVRYNTVMESAVQHPGATGFMLVHQAVVNFNRVLLWESRALTSPNVLVYEF